MSGHVAQELTAVGTHDPGLLEPTKPQDEPLPEWESFLRKNFLAWMMPTSRRQAISVKEAEAFLERVACRPVDMRLISAISLFADPYKAARFEELVSRHVPALLRVLPSRNEVVQRDWVGGFRGRLDVRRTVALHAAGKHTHFATRDRRRRVDLPETVLLATVLRELLGLLKELREEGLLRKSEWGGSLSKLEPTLRILLTKSALREVEPEKLTPLHNTAARSSPHQAYRVAATWQRWLDEAMRSDEARARHLAAGALAPLGPDQRFEVAVLLRLLKGVADLAEARWPGRWVRKQSAILSRHEHASELEWEGRARILFFYNKVVLPPGPRDQGTAHYLGNSGRLRPDITVQIERHDGEKRSMVLEVKRTGSPSYLAQGFGEALLYQNEYASSLIEWPKAVLVTEAPLRGEPRTTDEVVAIGWPDWPSAAIALAILDSAIA